MSKNLWCRACGWEGVCVGWEGGGAGLVQGRERWGGGRRRYGWRYETVLPVRAKKLEHESPLA